jgi:hypothetical protein
MAAQLAKALLTDAVEDQDLLRASLPNDLGGHCRAIDAGHTELERLSTDEKDFVERDLLADLAVNLLNAEQITRLNAVLLAAAYDNCVHLWLTFRSRLV